MYQLVDIYGKSREISRSSHGCYGAIEDLQVDAGSIFKLDPVMLDPLHFEFPTPNAANGW